MKEKNITLHPVLAMHGYAMSLSNRPGKRTYRFRVMSGDIEIRHNSYDSSLGLWCLPPESGDWETRALHSGEEALITIDSRIRDFEPDCVEVVNCHYGKRAVFSYQELACAECAEADTMAS